MALTKTSYSMISSAEFSVIDYGADKTGASDSSIAIQAAVDAAQVAGGVVVFPTGTYRFGGIEITKGYIKIDGRESIILPTTAAGKLFYIHPTTVNIEHIVIENFQVKESGGEIEYCIYAEQVSDTYYLRNVIVRNFFVHSLSFTCTAIVGVYVNSSTHAPTNFIFDNIRLLYVAGYWPPLVQHGFKIWRGAAAIAAGINIDNCTFTNIYGTYASHAVYVTTGSSFVFEKFSPGILFDGNHGIHAETDDPSGYGFPYWRVNDVQCEAQEANGIAVYGTDFRASTFTNVWSLKVNASATNLKAIDITKAESCVFENVYVKGLGGTEIGSGFHPALTLGATSKNNTVITSSPFDRWRRVRDLGIGNAYIGAGSKYNDSVPETVSATTVSAITTIKSFVISAGQLPNYSKLRIKASGTSTNAGTNTQRFGLMLQTSTKISECFDTISGAWVIDVELMVPSSTSQVSQVRRWWNNALVQQGRVTSSVNTGTTDLTISVFVQNLNSADTLTVDTFSVEYIEPTDLTLL